MLLVALATGRLTADAYVARIAELADGRFHMSASLYRRAVAAGEEIDSA